MEDKPKEETALASELPIFIKWMDFLKWLLSATEKFPKRTRFTFADRINNLALDVVEDIIEARYSKSKIQILQKANLRVEKIRMLLRICFEMRVIPLAGYKQAMYQLSECGKMFGGWIKQQKAGSTLDKGGKS